MLKVRNLIFAIVLVCLSIVDSPLAAEELIVSAASSLTEMFIDLERSFERRNHGVEVIMNFASSGSLYRQMEYGAPMDVYASANPQWMAKAIEKSLVNNTTQRIFAHNTLVLSIPSSNPAGITDLENLLNSDVTLIGVGSPQTVPVGQYAKKALTEAGLWQQLREKLIYGESTRQVLDYLQRGEVDAGLVYKTDAIKGGSSVSIVSQLELRSPVTYMVGIVQRSAKQQLAGSFIEFILTMEGQEIVKKYGFLPAGK